MIRLLSLGIPTVIVSARHAQGLTDGDEVSLDGLTGRLASPAPEEVGEPGAVPPAPAAGAPVLTADGVPVELRASVADIAGAARAVTHGAAAIGLVRSEFLVPSDGLPPDASFFETALKTLCHAAQPLAVTVRLLDLAADKVPAWLGPVPGLQGALGLQGVRLYDIEPVASVLRAQVEAVGRLSGQFDLRLLLPYVVRLEEFQYWRGEIERRLPIPLPIGTMAETPAAVLALTDWFELADFVAIGCNDLMQCLFAADRDQPELRGLLDPYAPVLFRFLRQAALAAGGHLGQLQVCGLLPQLPGAMPVMLGLGYRTFSVEPLLIPWLAQTVRQTDTSKAEALSAEICSLSLVEQVRECLSLPPDSVWAVGGVARP